jgi:acyl-coenzyme A thioesterase PaaI-like protein
MSRAPRSWPPEDAEPAVAHPDAPGQGSKLASHYDGCFACGDAQDAGLHLRTTVGETGVVHSRFVVTSAHQGGPGLAHGGLLACALDEALGSTVGHLLRVAAVTGKLETDFLRPVPVGSTLYIAAKLDGRIGRKVYVSADGRLGADDGPMAVRARALFVTVGIEHFVEHGDSAAVRKLARERADRTWEVGP